MGQAKEPNTTQKPWHPPKGQLVGYVRVSTFDQNENRQLEGVQIDRVFLDCDLQSYVAGFLQR